MIAAATFRELFQYNFWARDRQLEACAPLTEEQFLRPLGGSFPAVRDTLGHLLGVEWLYAERLEGRSPTAVPGGLEFTSVAALRARWLEVERQLRAAVERLDDRQLAESHTFKRINGQPRTQACWETLYHLLNHQSYHRGQVTTQLRLLGVTPPSVDYYVYLDSRK
jgi:uncharacterized damage-inducible protein DinB